MFQEKSWQDEQVSKLSNTGLSIETLSDCNGLSVPFMLLKIFSHEVTFESQTS